MYHSLNICAEDTAFQIYYSTENFPFQWMVIILSNINRIWTIHTKYI